MAEITNQLEYDDEVAFHGEQKLYDLARGGDARPWCLTVSFTHPHDPYVSRREFWDLYGDCDHLQPEVPALSYKDHDPHSRRIFDANDWRSYDITEDHVARARRAYFANISYLDAKIAGLLDVLDRTRQEAIVVFRVGSRRHAGGARLVVQDELLRGIDARAADDLGARPRTRPDRDARFHHRPLSDAVRSRRRLDGGGHALDRWRKPRFRWRKAAATKARSPWNTPRRPRSRR